MPTLGHERKGQEGSLMGEAEVSGPKKKRGPKAPLNFHALTAGLTRESPGPGPPADLSSPL